MNTHKLISHIENFLSVLVTKAGASKNNFVGGNITNEISKTWKDMVYVDINPQSDRDAYTTGSASIFLYSRPEGPLNRKNLRAAARMEERMETAIAECLDANYVIGVNWRDSGYNSQLDFFYNVINISITVK